MTIDRRQVELIPCAVSAIDLSHVKAFTAVDEVAAVAVVPDETVMPFFQVSDVVAALANHNVVARPGIKGIHCGTAQQEVIAVATKSFDRRAASGGIQGIVAVAAREHHFFHCAVSQIAHSEGIIAALTIDFKLFNFLVGQGEESQIEPVKDRLTIDRSEVKFVARAISAVDLSHIEAAATVDEVAAVAIVPNEAVMSRAEVGNVITALADYSVVA